MKTIFALSIAALLAAHAFAADAQWQTALQNPLGKARTENKLVLADFTGSDWCGWCIKFKKDVLDTPEFQAYAKTNLVLLELDFPHQTEQADALKKANKAWADKYRPDGYPTFLLLDSNGKVLGRQSGYLNGGPAAFIKQLAGWKAKAAPAKADGDALWLTDLPTAQAKARAEKKTILMDFTGSDWCGWCIKLHKEVFSQPEFIEYAKKNLVLLELDFPKRTPQPAALARANEQLASRFQIDGYPTVILLDADGNTIGRTGYQAGGPAAYTAMLDSLKGSSR